MRDLILVNSHDLQVQDTLNFWNSLNKINFSGTVGLISNDLKFEKEVLNYLPFQILQLEHKTSEYFRSSNRLFLYMKAIQQHGVHFDRVITTGIRDVIFQKPLEDMPSGYIDTFREETTQVIGKCPYNSKWILNAYGEEILQRLYNKPILCAEILCGTTQGMYELLKIMILEAEKHERKHDLEDQAILNYLHYTSQLNFTNTLWNSDSYVYTVGYVPELRVSRKKILNSYGEVPYIVHQYDRHLTCLQ